MQESRQAAAQVADRRPWEGRREGRWGGEGGKVRWGGGWEVKKGEGGGREVKEGRREGGRH